MRSTILALAFLGYGLAGAGTAAAQQAKKAADDAQPVSFTAHVIDLSCNFMQGASGDGHRSCAQACASKGQPLALMTDDGQFYLPINQGMGSDGENARLAEFAEQSVKVTGKVIKRAGMNALLIESITGA
ncbi:MAG TPA: hypothetical protein VF188_09800 [Longimicrobiales bacterium]